MINARRGGIEGICYITFSDLGKMSIKAIIAKLLSKRNKEINHLSNKTWRKTILRLHYISLPPKKKVSNA
jgi:hypothetical protein